MTAGPVRRTSLTDFWRNSGFHLLERSIERRLKVTDDFLRAYFLRPEIRPIDESCDNERALHESLLDEPTRPVAESELEALADPDARDNYRIVLKFRARLLAAGTLEACYVALFDEESVNVPPLFVNQLSQIILRNILDNCDDPLEIRASELLFREQKASIADGAIMLADLETVNAHASGGNYGSLGRLIVEANTPIRAVSLDVLDIDNAQNYWGRDRKHDFVISLNFGRAATLALCRVLEKWISHFRNVRVSVTPVRSIDDPRWAWHVGLDAEATSVLNDLWRGVQIEQDRLRRLLCLFKLEFHDPADMRSDIAGRPVYLALAMDEEDVVRVKPQNLLLNLPLARAS